MHYWKSILLTGSILLLAQSSVLGQYTLSVEEWAERDGLPYGAAQDLVRDERGLIWAATKGGLSRYDGCEFKRYNKDHGLSKYALVTRLFADGRYIWILYPELSARNEHITRVDVFDTWEERAEPLADHFGDQLPFDWTAVKRIRIGKGEVAFQLNSGELYLYRTGQGFERLAMTPSELASMLTPGGNRVEYNSSGANVAHVTIRSSLLDSTGIDLQCPMFNQGIFYLLERANGDRYLVQSDGQRMIYTSVLYRVQPDGMLQAVYTERDSVRAEVRYLADLDVFWWWSQDTAKLISPTGQVLFTHTEGLLRLDRNALLLADGDRIWQANASGITVFRWQRSPFQVLFEEPQWRGFRGIRRVRDALYFAHYDGVLRHSPKGHVERVIPSGLFLLVDSTDRIWTVNTRKIYCYDPAQDAYQWGYTVTIALNEVWAMAFRRMGGLYMSQAGLLLHRPFRSAAASPLTTPVAYNGFEELAQHTVYHFEPRADGRYWLCATSGLYVLDEERGVVARYWSGGKGEYFLPADDFRHLYHDATTDTYWLATGGSGLVEWRPADSYTQYHTFPGEVTNILHSVYPDDYGHLWMSTEGGLIQFDRTTYRYRIYTTQDGLPHNEFNRVSHFQDVDGTLYFGGEAVVRFHPRDWRGGLRPDVRVRPQVVAIQQYLGRSNREEWVTASYFETGRIRLRPQDRYFKVRLGLADVLLNEGATYYYRIVQHDEEWTKLADAELMLGRLPYGSQTIEVRVLLPNGQFTPSVLTLPLHVYRPFYLTWWFVLLCVVTIGGLFYGLYRYRIAQFEKRQHLRTQIATDLHDDVGSLLSRLALQAEMIKYVPRERVEAIIKDIIATSRTSIDTMRDIIWAIDARNDTTTDIFLRMEEQLEELLSPAGLSYHFNTKAVTCDQPLPPDVRQNLFFIFKEAITNAVKHSAASCITVTVVYNRRLFKMVIREEFTDRQERAEHPTAPRTLLTSHKKGSGIRNMLARAQRIGAHIDFVIDEGYTVITTLNL